MATPEETRDRIKEMRDRIFKDSDKDSADFNEVSDSSSFGAGETKGDSDDSSIVSMV